MNQRAKERAALEAAAYIVSELVDLYDRAREADAKTLPTSVGARFEARARKTLEMIHAAQVFGGEPVEIGDDPPDHA